MYFWSPTFPLIAHEQIAQNGIFSVCSRLITHFVKLLLRSGNKGLLKSDERMSNLKEQCAQL